MNDLISRRAAIEALCKMQCGCKPEECGLMLEADGAEECAEVRWIMSLPTIDTVKRGKWIAEPNCWYRCSNCGQHYPSIRGYMDYKYCPNCGARMENGDE